MSLTETQWQEVLTQTDLITPKMHELLELMYHQPGHTGAAGDLGKTMGYKGANTAAPLNAMVGRLGRSLLSRYGSEKPERLDGSIEYWSVIFDGWYSGLRFIWRIKPELVAALENGDHVSEAESLYPGEIDARDAAHLYEGAVHRVHMNAYERSWKARRSCIEHYGSNCIVCGFDFSSMYGDIGQGFIHVHHLTQLSEIGETYAVDPVKDLRPVCPNCHAMLHKRQPPYTLEQLQQIIRDVKEKGGSG